jgi:hypothetical protein
MSLRVVIGFAIEDGMRASEVRILVMPLKRRKLNAAEVLPILRGSAGFDWLKMPGMEGEEAEGCQDEKDSHRPQEQERDSLHVGLSFIRAGE